MPMVARHVFIAHCRRGGAFPMSDSMVSSNPAVSRSPGFLTTRSAVRAHPAAATPGSASAIHDLRNSSACGLFLTT